MAATHKEVLTRSLFPVVNCRSAGLVGQGKSDERKPVAKSGTAANSANNSAYTDEEEEDDDG